MQTRTNANIYVVSWRKMKEKREEGKRKGRGVREEGEREREGRREKG
jgi:hypothetical protein